MQACILERGWCEAACEFMRPPRLGDERESDETERVRREQRDGETTGGRQRGREVERSKEEQSNQARAACAMPKLK